MKYRKNWTFDQKISAQKSKSILRSTFSDQKFIFPNSSYHLPNTFSSLGNAIFDCISIFTFPQKISAHFSKIAFSGQKFVSTGRQVIRKFWPENWSFAKPQDHPPTRPNRRIASAFVHFSFRDFISMSLNFDRKIERGWGYFWTFDQKILTVKMKMWNFVYESKSYLQENIC